MKVGSLCTGYGGLDMAVGGDLAWVSDIDKAANTLLEYRHPTIPNLGDLKQIDWQAVERVDVLTAGYPCQPFSVAGKQKGIEDERHIWPWIIDGIRILRPRHVVLENVAGHLRLGFGDVLGSLAEAGYDARWCCVRASDIGAPHRRERVFIVASLRHPGHDAGGPELGQQPQGATGWAVEPGQDASSDTHLSGLEGHRKLHGEAGEGETSTHHQIPWGGYEPAIRRWESVLGRDAPHPSIPNRNGNPVLDPRFVEWMMGLPEGHVTGVPGLSRTAQLKLLGNGVVPQQAEYALSQIGL